MKLFIILKKVSNLCVGIIYALLLWPVYLFSCLVPRKKDLWVFGSFQGNFVDNSKYLFLQAAYYSAEFPVRAVWISFNNEQAREIRSRGFQCYSRYSLQGIFYSLQASVYIVSWSVKDINFWLSGGATVVNLWHGLPFKKVGKDNDVNKKGVLGGALKNSAWRKRLEFFINPVPSTIPDYFLSSSSAEMHSIFRRTFPAKYHIRSLYPRDEHFLFHYNQLSSFIKFASTKQERELIDSFGKYTGVWVYMPTFRDNKKDDKILHSSEALDFAVLDEILSHHNVLLLVKYHYVMLKGLKNQGSYKNIKFVDPKMDMYIVLPFTSGLITDYSSILYDYMLLKKPMLFYAFDLQSYQQNSRELYFPYDDVALGDKVTSFDELCKWFNDGRYNNAPQEYSDAILRFWGEVNSKRVFDTLYSRQFPKVSAETNGITSQLVQNG